jgi:hypothetical protein
MRGALVRLLLRLAGQRIATRSPVATSEWVSALAPQHSTCAHSRWQGGQAAQHAWLSHGVCEFDGAATVVHAAVR